MTRCVMTAAVVALAVVAAGAGEISLQVTPQADGENVPVLADVNLPSDVANVAPGKIAVTMTGPGGATAAGQVVRFADDAPVQLAWLLPKAAKGKAQDWSARLAEGKPAGEAFRFQDTKGKHLDLLLGDRVVTRYMYEWDPAAKGDERFDIAKVFTHVFNAAGEPITKGTGGQYPHHRGIFLGFSKLGYAGGKRNDWWHVRNVAQNHVEFADLTAGPVLASSTMVIHWNDGAGKPVVIERRRQTVWRQDGALMLMDFVSELTPAEGMGPIELKGDPEHAGMQYRPANEVDRKATKYVFPTKEITSGNVKKQLDLPWAAENYVLNDKHYCVQHMNHPSNPKGTKYSAYRNYGRFGAYPEATVKQGETQTLRYRIWVAAGDCPGRDAFNQQYANYAAPPKAAAK